MTLWHNLSMNKLNPFSKLNFKSRRRIPNIYQSEAAECGLACLAMISWYHGNHISMVDLRKQNSVSLRGMDMSNMSYIAKQMSFSTRALSCDLDTLKDMQLPCILHWNFDHFVVLEKIKHRKFHIVDPASGARSVDEEEFSRKFTGVALELHPTTSFKRKEVVERVRLRDVFKSVPGIQLGLLRVLILSVLMQGLVLLGPLINQVVVDGAISSGSVDFLYLILLGFGLLLVLRVLTRAVRDWVLMILQAKMAYHMRSTVMRHLLRLTTRFFESRHIGDVTSRVSSLKPIQEFFTSSAISVLLDSIMLIVSLIVMAIYSVVMAGIVIAFSCVVFIARAVTFRYVINLERDQLEREASLDTASLEDIRGMRAIKIFGREDFRHSRWQSLFADSINVKLKLMRFSVLSQASGQFSDGLLDILLFLTGGMMIINGDFSIGMLFAFLGYRTQFSDSSKSMIETFFRFKTVDLHLERLADIAFAETEKTGGVPVTLSETKEELLSLKHVYFRYSSIEDWVLQDISFSLKAGDKIGIVGPSGGGKSTLLKLLIGLYPSESGEIAYNHVPLKDINFESFRSQIGVVMQDDQLLSGTIADNISFFDANVSLERVEAVAKAASIHKGILLMPMGYNSLIGDMGSSLSGGQLQRILIARALYRQPKILFMDEGTANLDEKSQAALVEVLDRLEIPQVLIAHRPGAIAHCDRIITIDQGRITKINNVSGGKEVDD